MRLNSEFAALGKFMATYSIALIGNLDAARPMYLLLSDLVAVGEWRSSRPRRSSCRDTVPPAAGLV